MERCRAFTRYNNSITCKLISEADIVYNDKVFHTDKAQWDTGATSTCISKKVIQKLDMVHSGKSYLGTLSGEEYVKTYFIKVILPNDVTVTDVRAVESDIENWGIDILIGMDIILLGDFAISNYDGKTQFTFRIPSQEHVDFVKRLRKSYCT